MKGTIPINIERVVAVVGTRKCTEYGASCAAEIAHELADLGYPLISGLALGIDAAAHRASISKNAPTVAVLAHGLDRIHPYAFTPPPEARYSRIWEGNLELILGTKAFKIDDPKCWAKQLEATDLIIDSADATPNTPLTHQASSTQPKIPEPCQSVVKEIAKNSVETPARLSKTLKVGVRTIRTRLFVLELLGWVRRVPGDRYVLA